MYVSFRRWCIIMKALQGSSLRSIFADLIIDDRSVTLHAPDYPSNEGIII